MNKIITLVTSIIIILTLAGGVIWYTQKKFSQSIKLRPAIQHATPQSVDAQNTATGDQQPPMSIIDTSNWLTYKNEEYGFELKHPKELETNLDVFSDGLNIPNAKILLSFGSNKESALSDSQLKVGIIEYIPNSYFLRQQYNEVLEYLREIGLEKYKENVKNINNVLVDTFERISNGKSETIYLLSLYKKHGLIPSGILILQNADSSYSEIYKQIMNSVKLIEDKVDITDWLTYKNKEYGFELKYPKEVILKEVDRDSSNLGTDNTRTLVIFDNTMNEDMYDYFLGVYLIKNTFDNAVKQFRNSDADLFPVFKEENIKINNVMVKKMLKSSAELPTVDYFIDLGVEGVLVLNGAAIRAYQFQEDIMKTIKLIQ